MKDLVHLSLGEADLQGQSTVYAKFHQGCQVDGEVMDPKNGCLNDDKNCVSLEVLAGC